MTDSFDPYHKWLGIKPKDQPANHYRLLGVELFETDQEVIQNAADQRMRHVRSLQAGANAELSQRLLNEISAARACLSDPQRQQQYDQQLKFSGAPPAAPPSHAPPAHPPPAHAPPASPPTLPPAPPPRSAVVHAAAPAPIRRPPAEQPAVARTPRTAVAKKQSLPLLIWIVVGAVAVCMAGVLMVVFRGQRDVPTVAAGDPAVGDAGQTTAGSTTPLPVPLPRPKKTPKSKKPARPAPTGELKLYPIDTITLKPGEQVHVQLKVHDPEQWKDFAWYSLGPEIPNDTRIDPESGELHWTPPANAIKSYQFSVEARYNQSVDSARFRVELPWARGNLVFDGIGGQTTTLNQELVVPLKLHDDLGDARGVKFQVSGEKVTGATVDAERKFHWRPSNEEDAGQTRYVTIYATDDRGATASQSLSIKVEGKPAGEGEKKEDAKNDGAKSSDSNSGERVK
ncbi:MAG: hypothetical protein K8T25_00245 [Planctomycetia bacterium]|nr:hypothetical protein [Planctomycetia bacterium]